MRVLPARVPTTLSVVCTRVLNLRGVVMPFFMLCDVAILPGEIFRACACWCSCCMAPCHSDYPYTRSRAAFYGTPMALALQRVLLPAAGYMRCKYIRIGDAPFATIKLYELFRFARRFTWDPNRVRSWYRRRDGSSGGSKRSLLKKLEIDRKLFMITCACWCSCCALCHSDYPYTRSRAAFYGTPMALALQVKCTIPSLCSQGAKVVVTDHGEGDRTDFILSPRAFAKLALPNKVSELKKYGVVDIKYQKISCEYPGNNIKIKIHESSRYPNYLAILIIYKGGKSEITAVELLQSKQWKAMRNAYGAIAGTCLTLQRRVLLPAAGYMRCKYIRIRYAHFATISTTYKFLCPSFILRVEIQLNNNANEAKMLP
ncbi:hypothetical protein Sjap_004590 [Stephania japonica]|uniref:Expansin-like EG45 domain-containing protein n=1 Tax=Stephania japonica TaxID=461633 RepID=A0AAP0K2M6_9MAGN